MAKKLFQGVDKGMLAFAVAAIVVMVVGGFLGRAHLSAPHAVAPIPPPQTASVVTYSDPDEAARACAPYPTEQVAGPISSPPRYQCAQEIEAPE